MELTQRLECTQEFSQINNDKILPDQIGFLGICGNKYPLKKGPNKIGRDPDTCSVVLDVNSISRQHAVINILNQNEFMLMDLDSANKTKLSGKTLLPYIPSPLKNGDMVQFGQVFGVFRLFEEENDLPMTQAINVPETPVQSRCISKLNIQATTIPESPDFSDRDDSFIAASQQKQAKKMFKSPTDNFLKTSGKTIQIKPIGSNKIDNVYWTSSKKSESFTSQANISNDLNDSSKSIPIHELETQLPYDDKDDSNHCIYNALTQVGEENPYAIHEMETQLPPDLLEVYKINYQQNVQIDFSILDNKENENVTNNSEKEFETRSLNIECSNADKKSNTLNSENSKEKLDVSNDVILFDEIDSPPLDDHLESQSLMPPDIITNDENPLICENIVKESGNEESKSENNDQNIKQKINRRQSGDSTDCEDDIYIAMTQKIGVVTNDDDVTDCEDEPVPKSAEKEKVTDENLTDCEDEPENAERPIEITENVKFEDLCTQVIEEMPLNMGDNVGDNVLKKQNALDDLQDMCTQVIEEIPLNIGDNVGDNVLKKQNALDDLQDMCTQVIEEMPLNMEDNVEGNVLKKQNALDDLQDMCTQVIEEMPLNVEDNVEANNLKKPNVLDDLPTQIIENDKLDISLSDLQTQVIEKEDSEKNVCLEEALTQKIYSEEIINFKMPGPSPFRRKRKIVPNIEKQLSSIIQVSKTDIECEKKDRDDDEIYYAATQELIIDLCTQRELSPEIVKQPKMTLNTNKKLSLKSTKDSKIEHQIVHESNEECDIEEKINSFVANLSKSEVMGVASTEKNSNALIHKSNDDSDLKVPLKSKESKKIKKISLKAESHKDEIIIEKSLQNKSKAKDESDQNLLNSNKNVINLEHKKKNNSDIRSYLNKNTKAKEVLPSRSSRRIRKPTSRLKDCDEDSQKLCNSLFNTTIYTDDDKTKKDLENILKSKDDKKKTKMDSEKKRKNDGKEKVKDESITKSEHKQRKSRRTKDKNEVKNENIEKELDVNKVKESDVKNSRNSRSRSKKSENDHNKSKSPLNDKRKSDKKNHTESKEREKTLNDKRKSDKKNHTESKEKEKKSPEREIRRSKRHRTSKKSEESSSENKSHKISNGHENSTVYNLSSESGIDSPNKLKRSGNFEYPSAKKTRTVTSLRSTPARKIKTQYVLFTAFPCEEVRKKLEKLGAIIVSDVSKCTVVLTLQIKRTFKLLCAVGLGRPVVGPAWVQACADTNMVVDPWLYLIKDEVTEKRFDFNLERSLAGKRNFLSGYNVSSTPNVMPNAEEMKLIVECSGGKWKEQGPLWICVSCVADKSLWPTLKKKGAIIVSTEFILGGVLRQKLDIDKNRLI